MHSTSANLPGDVITPYILTANSKRNSFSSVGWLRDLLSGMISTLRKDDETKCWTFASQETDTLEESPGIISVL